MVAELCSVSLHGSGAALRFSPWPCEPIGPKNRAGPYFDVQALFSFSVFLTFHKKDFFYILEDVFKIFVSTRFPPFRKVFKSDDTNG